MTDQVFAPRAGRSVARRGSAISANRRQRSFSGRGAHDPAARARARSSPRPERTIARRERGPRGLWASGMNAALTIQALERWRESERARLRALVNAELGFTVSQVARELGVSAGTVRRWTDEGDLGCYRTPGNQRRFSHEQLEAFVARCEATHEPHEPHEPHCEATHEPQGALVP
jgi:excisionase family DNA binding protein